MKKPIITFLDTVIQFVTVRLGNVLVYKNTLEAEYSLKI